MLRAVQSNNKKAVLPSGEPRDAAVNFDRYQILQWQLQEKYARLYNFFQLELHTMHKAVDRWSFWVQQYDWH